MTKPNFSCPNWLDSLHPAYGYLFFVLHQLVLLCLCHHDQAHCFFILNDHHMPIPNSFTVATCTLGRAHEYFSHIITLFVCLFLLIDVRSCKYNLCQPQDQAHFFFLINDHHMPIPNSFCGYLHSRNISWIFSHKDVSKVKF